MSDDRSALFSQIIKVFAKWPSVHSAGRIYGWHIGHPSVVWKGIRSSLLPLRRSGFRQLSDFVGFVINNIPSIIKPPPSEVFLFPQLKILNFGCGDRSS